MDLKITAIIEQIEQAVKKSEKLLTSIGLDEGILGVSLFNCYLYLSSQQESYLACVSSPLDQVFERLSGDSLNHLKKTDLLELGKYLCFLHKHGLIDKEDLKTYLYKLEPAIKKSLDTRLAERDFDSTAGALAVGHYLLEAMPTRDYAKWVEEIVDALEKRAITQNGACFWYFVLRDKHKPIVELGFLHGIAGVVYFLARSLEKGIRVPSCRALIDAALRFLLKHKEKNGVNYFPFDSNSGEKLNYQNLAYGDLGIGYALYETGRILENKHYLAEGLDILKNSASFTDRDNTHIRDAELAYGSSGLFAVFGALKKRTGCEAFGSAADYWLNKTLHHNKNDTPWAGFNTYYNGFLDETQLSFSHGVIGIGISLLNHLLGREPDYLSFFNFHNL